MSAAKRVNSRRLLEAAEVPSVTATGGCPASMYSLSAESSDGCAPDHIEKPPHVTGGQSGRLRAEVVG